AEITLEQILWEVIVTGGDGRVRGEHDTARNAHRGIAESLAFHPQAAGPLASGECCMPLVEVNHVRLEADRAQRTHAADAEHDLLLKTMFVVAAIEPVRDATVLRSILRHVR